MSFTNNSEDTILANVKTVRPFYEVTVGTIVVYVAALTRKL